MQKRKIIMDVDTGTDDAVALTLAMLCDEFDLLGITTVAGNLEVKLTTDNTLRVVECCQKQAEVGVYQGCEYPLVCTLWPGTTQAQYPLPKREGGPRDKYAVHADHLPLPAPKLTPQRDSAVVWLINTLLAAGDGEITLVPVGPMTNIAAALRADPRIIPKISEIVLMGGAREIGNAEAMAEFNIWADPEAMEILLQSGCKITLVPLDATHKALLSLEQADEIAALGTPPAKLVADIIRERISRYGLRSDEIAQKRQTPMHDALALCYVLHPQVLPTVLHCNCHVDIAGGRSYGQTVVDLRGIRNDEGPNCYFAVDADAEFFYSWMYGILKRAADETAG